MGESLRIKILANRLTTKTLFLLPTYRRALLSERLEKAISKPKNKGKNSRSKPKETSCLQAWYQWQKPDFLELEKNSSN